MELVSKYSSSEDREASYTINGWKDLFSLMGYIKENMPVAKRVLDLGCGFGGLTRIVGEFLHAKEFFGIEVDSERVAVARNRGITVFPVDLERKGWPLDDKTIDLAISFGVLEHLALWDSALHETSRVVKDGGFILFSIPNMASYVQRLSILFGYQPREVEVSRVFLPGVMPVYSNCPPSYHLHTLTLRALTELLRKYGFEVRKAKSIRAPAQNMVEDLRAPKLLDAIDRLLSLRPSLARRFALVAQKIKL